MVNTKHGNHLLFKIYVCKNGAPMRVVTAPTGNSEGDIMVLAIISEKITSAPLNIADVGRV